MYELLERVEVIDTYGRSYGNITEFLDDGRYRVYLNHLRKEVVMSGACLRPLARPDELVGSSQADTQMEGAMESGTVKAAEKLDVRTAASEQPDQPAASETPIYDMNEVAVDETCENRDRAADISASLEKNMETSGDIIKPPTKKRTTYKRKGKQYGKAPVVFKEPSARNGETPAPFAKTSRIWEAINSLEIFQRMPQRPHFSPLLSSKEINREGLAVGAMVTFSCLVEKIPKFTLGEPASLLEDYMEMLSNLETHGFIVEPIRKRVNSLLSIKTRYDKAQALSRELIREKEAVSEMGQKIANINEQIRRLEDERAAAEAERAAADDEIRALQVQVNEVREFVDGARGEFERAANAPW